MNGFHVAGDVGPKPEALGAIVTQPFTLHLAETHAKEVILHVNLRKSNRRSQGANSVGHITKL
jgi:hypothetical protein